MKLHKAVQLACPLDGQPLASGERRYFCPDGHSFDVARQGYVNLLPVQQKRTRSPGDSGEMIAARQRFLGAGFYDRIAEELFAMLHDLGFDNEACLLDAGCGEGFYLDFLYRKLAADGLSPGMAGLDISKAAIVAAAKRNKNVTWLVASNKQPPLLPRSVDVIVCMFGFPVFDAFKQILKPGGKLLLVEAGSQHLIELRRVIYEQLKQRSLPELGAALAQGFELQGEEGLTYKVELSAQQQIDDLLLMTPHLFRASKEGKQRAAGLKRIELTVDVSFRLLRLTA